ncbi:hypothetical protein ACQY0O_001256 [Thecaphora frezii]
MPPRPGTARPTTSASRPTTRAGSQPSSEPTCAGSANFYLGGGHVTIHEHGSDFRAHDGAYYYQHEGGEEVDDDEDDDVFAFVPPGSGQDVAIIPSSSNWQHFDIPIIEGAQSRFSPDTETLHCDGQDSCCEPKYGSGCQTQDRYIKPSAIYSRSDGANCHAGRNVKHAGHLSNELDPSQDYSIKEKKSRFSGASSLASIDKHTQLPYHFNHDESSSYRMSGREVGDAGRAAHEYPNCKAAVGSDLRASGLSTHDTGPNRTECDAGPQTAAFDSFELLKTVGYLAGERTVELELEEEEDSPYPEVRASVSNVDDPSMPVITFRSMLLGFVLTCLISATNTLLALRNPPIQITGVIVQLLVHPLGKLMAATLPYRTFQAPKWLGGSRFSLNPGLWNIKEHTIVNIFTSYGVNPPYPLPLLLMQDLPRFWNEPRPLLFSLLFICAPQLIGMGLAGFSRDILIRPASMIWPQNLATTTILNTLHAEDEPEDGSMKRIKFFTIVSAGAFVAYFFPGYLFMALSYLNWVCWIWPDNVPVNTVFGVAHGLGASVLTLDWTQINFIGNPLINPWWAQVNIFGGFVIGLWIAAPAIYFTNTWYTGYFPILSGATYDRYGQIYDIQRVSSDHRSLDKEAYKAYSPVYISAGLVVTYTSGFAILTASIVHTALHHGKSLWRNVRYKRTEEDDIHSKLIHRYRQVPQWWNAAILLFAFLLCVVLVVCYDTGLPVWALVLSILVPAFYLLPFGLIYAMTGLSLTVNLIAEMVASYLFPHHTMAMMTFKTISQHTMNSILQLTQDQKLGHYMKVPPRQIFSIQILAILISGLVQALTKDWMVSSIDGLCTPNQADSFTCTSANVFYSASVIWGQIGAQRTFGPGSIYHTLYYGLTIGAVAPVVVWLLAQKFPRWKFQFMSTPIIFAGMNYAPPAQGINFTSWFAVGYLFQYVLRKRAFAWWTRYNFVTAGALDFGTILSSLVIFFALQLPKDGALVPNWWGNDAFTKTADYQSRPLLKVPPEGFGPLPNA